MGKSMSKGNDLLDNLASGTEAATENFAHIFIFKFFRLNWHWFLIGGQMIIAVYLLIRTPYALVTWTDFRGDELSYINFDWSSLESALGGHRSMGFPLVIQVWKFFSNDYTYWATFQMCAYFLSVLFLFIAVFRNGYHLILGFILATFLIWYTPIYYYFRFIITENLAASFLNLTIGMLLFFVRKEKLRYLFLLGLFSFALFQVRSALAYVPALIPLWASFFCWAEKGKSTKRWKRVFLKTSLVTVGPLILFILLRWTVVGHFGVISLNGVLLSGHATQYLDEENIQTLTGESRAVARKILARKRKLSRPCNATPFPENHHRGNFNRYKEEARCFGVNLMTAWMVAIDQLDGDKPFQDPNKNLEAWKHVPLSPFFTRYNVHIDNLLMEFSKEIINKEWDQYLRWVVNGTFFGLETYWLQARKALKWKWVFAAAVLFGILQRLLSKRNVLIGKMLTNRFSREAFAFAGIALTLFLAGFFPIILLNTVIQRFFILHGIYIYPAVVLTTLAIVGLKFSWTRTPPAPKPIE